jgi:hypothetical protein
MNNLYFIDYDIISNDLSYMHKKMFSLHILEVIGVSLYYPWDFEWTILLYGHFTSTFCIVDCFQLS